MSPSIDEKYDSAESDDSISRWQNRNPTKIKPEYQPTRIRQNPPRYQSIEQDKSDKYK